MNPLVLYAGHETGAGGGLGDGGWPQTDTALSVVGTAAAGWLLGRRRTAWGVHFESISESFDLLNYVRLWKTAGLLSARGYRDNSASSFPQHSVNREATFRVEFVPRRQLLNVFGFKCPALAPATSSSSVCVCLCGVASPYRAISS